MTRLITFLLLLAFPFKYDAQDLSLDEAIKIALSNNLGIKVAQNQEASAKNNAHAGNAGLYPKLDATGSATLSQSNASIDFAGNIPSQENVSATSQNYAAGLALSYVFFDGLGNVRTLQKLNLQKDLSSIQTKVTIESTLLQVVVAYYDLARQQVLVNTTLNALNISRDRLNRASKNAEFGSISNIEVLNARVDYYNDSSALIQARQGAENAAFALNQLLSRPTRTAVFANENLSSPVLPVFDDLKTKADANSASLLLTQMNLDVSEIDRKLWAAQFMPRLSGNASYGYNRAENNASIVLLNESLGFTGGLTLTWNLFDGFKTKQALQNAKIAIESASFKKEEALLSIEKELSTYHNTLLHALEIISLESANAEVAALNLKRSQELYRVGQITGLQFRQAQQNVVAVNSRLANAKFTAVIADYQIRRITGVLVN